MLVVHGFWSPDRGLCLWSEDSERTVKSPSQAMRQAGPHPFAAPADLVGEHHPGKQDTATLLLPSVRTAPLDSPELIRVAPRRSARAEPTLLPWTVPVVWRPVLQGPDAVALHNLVAAMPPVCRAESDPTGSTGQDPTELTSAALHALTDEAMRERLLATRGPPVVGSDRTRPTRHTP